MLALALASACSPGAPPNEDVSIRKQLMSTWSSAEAPLTIDPIVVAGDHAVADWTQPTVGGRALLYRHENQWHVVLCAGDALKDAQQLESSGVPAALARELASKLAQAEKAVSTERLARMASFRGVVRMDQHETAGHAE